MKHGIATMEEEEEKRGRSKKRWSKKKKKKRKRKRRGPNFTPLVFLLLVAESIQVWLSWLSQTWVNSPKKKSMRNLFSIFFFRILQRFSKREREREKNEKGFLILQKEWKKEKEKMVSKFF